MDEINNSSLADVRHSIKSLKKDLSELNKEQTEFETIINILEKSIKHNSDFSKKLNITKEYFAIEFYTTDTLFNYFSKDKICDINNFHKITSQYSICKIKFFPGKDFLTNYRKAKKWIDESNKQLNKLLKEHSDKLNSILKSKRQIKEKTNKLSIKKEHLIEKLSQDKILTSQKPDYCSETIEKLTSPRDKLFVKAMSIKKKHNKYSYIRCLDEANEELNLFDDASSIQNQNDFTKWRKRNKDKI